MDGYGVNEILMIIGVSILFCPSLLALPAWIWAAWRKPLMGNKKLFLVGMGLHVLGFRVVKVCGERLSRLCQWIAFVFDAAHHLVAVCMRGHLQWDGLASAQACRWERQAH